MSAVPCANHPKEVTFVRCGRCEKPICTRCMVDSPVGKKCRDCARNRSHLHTSTPKNVLLAFAAASAVAVPAAFAMHLIPLIYIAPVVYGGVVGEVALRAGQRRRSPAMQCAAGVAALLGGLAGCALPGVLPLLLARADAPAGSAELPSMAWSLALGYPLVMTLIGTAVAVSRVRFF